MIEFVKGKIYELTPASVVIETSAGVGYIMSISLATFSALEGKSEALVLVHESVREDAYQLYGFATSRERELFRLLVGVSGVGAGTARMILSAMTCDEVENVVANSDVKRLKSVKGVGAKTAERIIVDLRDKIKPAASAFITEQPQSEAMYDEALTALTVLGYARAQAQKVLDKVFAEDPSTRVEVAIRRALAML